MKHSATACTLIMLLIPVITLAQADNYFPSYPGAHWNYTFEFTDIPEEFEEELPEDFPEALVIRDSLVSIEQQNATAIYHFMSRPLFEEFDEFNEDPDEFNGNDYIEYAWMTRDDEIGPWLGMVDDFDDEPAKANKEFSAKGAISLIASELDTDEFFLPMYRFNTQEGDSWDIFSLHERFEVPEDEFNFDDEFEEDEFLEGVDSIGIQMTIQGSRLASEVITVDGIDHQAEAFETSFSLVIELVMSEEDFEMELPLIDNYTFQSYWAQNHGLVRLQADAYTIDFDFEDDFTASASVVSAITSSATVTEEDMPEEFTIPGYSLQMSEFEEGESTSALTDAQSQPERIALAQNYPNPFNPETTITYELTESGPVRLDIYDIYGRHVTTLLDEHQHAGTHRITWDAAGMSSGTYIFRLRTGNTVLTREMTLVK